MESDKAVKACSECPLCKFTRNSRKATLFYKIARLIQRICPCCRMANKTSDKDLQKSNFF